MGISNPTDRDYLLIAAGHKELLLSSG